MQPQDQNQPEPTPPQAQTNTYPVQVTIAYPAHQSRLLALFSLPYFLIRVVMLIPQLILLSFVQIAGLIVAWLNIWAVLFTGHSSPGMHKFVVGTTRWSTRVNAYLMGLSDKYPPFRLDP